MSASAQGINWTGPPEAIKAVIVRSRNGSYDDDGWHSQGGELFAYAFKARKGQINPKETANRCLIRQRHAGYPILLLIERGDVWACAGRFDVHAIAASYVTLRRIAP